MVQDECERPHVRNFCISWGIAMQVMKHFFLFWTYQVEWNLLKREWACTIGKLVAWQWYVQGGWWPRVHQVISEGDSCSCNWYLSISIDYPVTLSHSPFNTFKPREKIRNLNLTPMNHTYPHHPHHYHHHPHSHPCMIVHVQATMNSFIPTTAYMFINLQSIILTWGRSSQTCWIIWETKLERYSKNETRVSLYRRMIPPLI